MEPDELVIKLAALQIPDNATSAEISFNVMHMMIRSIVEVAREEPDVEFDDDMVSDILIHVAKISAKLEREFIARKAMMN